MPWYRINGMTVHMRGTNLPPGCQVIVGMHTGTANCLVPSGFQCDWPTPENTSRGRGYKPTCDSHLCQAHAHQVGANKHYCPAHFREHADSQAQPGLFTSLVQA
jgi:hypothetical protein